MIYSEPTPADLKARYAPFAAVADATITYWLIDAGRFVDQSWSEGDYAPAKLAAAAHNMVRAGVEGLASSQVAGMAAAGMTAFRSGSFSASFSEDAVKAQVAGGWASTSYGVEYAELLYRNRGGPRVSASGVPLAGCGYNGWAGPLPSWQQGW